MKDHKNYTYEEIPEEESGEGLHADLECDECNINLTTQSKFTRFELQKHKRYAWKLNSLIYSILYLRVFGKINFKKIMMC